MRVFKRCSSSLAVILEDQNVFEAPVFLKIENAVAEGPQNIFNSFRRQRCQTRIVIRRFDDYFVGADAVHTIEHALGLPIQGTLNSKCRKLVGNYSHRPSWRVSLWPRSTIRVGPISLNLRRRLAFIPVTKGAEASLDLHVFPHEIRWALRPIGRDNYPTSNNRIFSELRHFIKSFQ